MTLQQQPSFGDTRIGDLKGTLNRAPQAGLSLWRRYCQRYLLSNQRGFAPYIHAMLLAGGLGYSFHYAHHKGTNYKDSFSSISDSSISSLNKNLSITNKNLSFCLRTTPWFVI